jgi:hypothetical protein
VLTVTIRRNSDARDARDGTTSLPYRTSWDDAPAAALFGYGVLERRERLTITRHRTNRAPPRKSMTAGSVADAVPLLPDRLSSLAGYIIERVLNEGTEPESFVVGARPVLRVDAWGTLTHALQPLQCLATSRHNQKSR